MDEEFAKLQQVLESLREQADHLAQVRLEIVSELRAAIEKARLLAEQAEVLGAVHDRPIGSASRHAGANPLR